MKGASGVGVLGVLLVLAFSVAGCQSSSFPPLESHATNLPTATQPVRGLRGQFFGTTSILIRDEQNVIMVDGFFSRPGLWELLCGLGKVEPDLGRIDHALAHVDSPTVDLLLVAHSHHDHAMDAPIVAQKKTATLVGSESTRNIARGLGRDDVPFHVAGAGRQLNVGAFKITIFETPHSPHKFAALEGKLQGVIDKPLRTPAKITDYKAGANYVFFIDHPEGKFLVVPSANVPLRLGHTKADAVFLSIGNLDLLSNEQIRMYWKEAVEDTDAKLVIPVHWDNFGRSLMMPLRPFPSFVDNVACAMETLMFLGAGRVNISFMPLFETVAFNAISEPPVRRNIPSQVSVMPDPFTQGCRAGRE
jgi:L-ascorbate metabolism protein UlaG (beta-lactamase superfamily)